MSGNGYYNKGITSIAFMPAALRAGVIIGLSRSENTTMSLKTIFLISTKLQLRQTPRPQLILTDEGDANVIKAFYAGSMHQSSLTYLPPCEAAAK